MIGRLRRELLVKCVCVLTDLVRAGDGDERESGERDTNNV